MSTEDPQISLRLRVVVDEQRLPARRATRVDPILTLRDE
jgi:hypothetical protein